MASVRTVEFLPEIFQTPANRQFLAGTLDQLVQEPNFSTSQGYIGRRIGPGVNANDDYVVEPTVERANYQLEPGVVLTSEDKVEALDAITYPGILNALELQGSQTSQASRLFSSDYYCWDPFIDLDKMVNFAEYYWLPGGPFSVVVQGRQIPYERNINVTRNQNSYTFDFQSNQPNPTITLVRGGSYQFIVNQNVTSTFTFRVTNRGSNAYIIDYQSNPTLALVRGNTYQFVLNLGGDFPFYIKTEQSLGTTNLYSQGVVNNGAVEGQVTFTVPYDAPDTLYYASGTSELMRGVFNIVEPTAGFGPKFWIQADQGIDGVMQGNPNISSRDVLGVENNGVDSGVVTFNVPQKTAQNFFYDLAEIPNVDIISDIQFADINHVYVNGFFEAYPNGIDGVVNLENRTIVFVDQSPMTDLEDAYFYGWYRTQFYNPVPPSTGVNEPGTYDVDGFSTDTPILAKEDRYQVYQIQIETGLDGAQYFNLVPVLAVPIYTKFYVSSGETYSNTQWYKNSDGFFEKIPLLTAALDVLFYQDSVNPSIYGEIRLIEQTQDATIFIDDIVGKKYYTSPNGVVFTNGLKVQFQGSVLPESYVNQSYYVEGVGIAIKLLPVLEFITPETYTENTTLPFDSVPYDIGNYDVDANQPLLQDYLTLNRASPDRNAWSRSNRWFHRSVIEATALYTQTTALLDQEQRAKRPILEFRAGMQLFDFGTKAKTPINVIDFTTKDAFSQVAGATQYNIDGYQLTDGSRIIFAADTNPDVRNKIYTVTFISPDTEPPLISQPIIALTLTSDAEALYNETLVCINGITQQGVSFWFDGVTWQRAQQKTKTNQAPLFNIYDRQGVSLSDNLKYAGSSFKGSTLFAYAQGTGINDLVLNFPLQYLTISNVGDIVFDNTFYTNTFLYVVNRASVETPISIGVTRQYFDRTAYQDLIGWQPAVTSSHQYQQFRFAYDGKPLLLDIAVTDVPVSILNDIPPPSLKIYVGAKFLSPRNYEVTITANTTSIRLLNTYTPDDVIEVLAYSNQLSEVGFYQIPTNLENNPFNDNSSNFTLGTVRTHYESIGENLTNLIGPINGSNNSRDLGNILPYGETILQQSSPLTLSGLFLRQPEYNVFSALTFNSLEYVKYKNLLLDTLTRNDYSNLTTAQILTSAISEITLGRTDTYPFYWSDMLPAGAVFVENNYTYTAISTPVFETTQVYDFTASNYLALNVYVNNHLLTRGYEFITNVNAPSLEILIPLAVGDIITIQEFSSTVGSFCPNTPTKMGLYPSWQPKIYLDTSYITPQTIILGHDGSKTVAFGDFRDAVLLEFETRIFNNLKITSPIPIEPWEVIPGQFRNTDYTADEIQNIFDEEFLSWVGWNKLDYTNQEFRVKDEFTWNYRQAGNKLTGESLPGAWRGIYLYFYDTVTPNTTPWEMLGFTQKPTWWDQRYGPSPYTSGNLVLWDDLEAGRVADPAGFYIKPAFARPGLTQILPVGPTGDLLSPFDSIVGAYDPTAFKSSWQTGDYGPVEYSWRASSSFPFAVMRLLALTRTAEFFSLFADRDLYKFDDVLNQYLYNQRYRLDANGIEIYGLGTSKASFINWIVDYNSYLGNLQAPNRLTTALKSLDVRLCYRMAGFTNKQYLKIFLEKPSPSSVNTSLLLPDSSVDLLLYKNQPFDETNYSSVIVQKDINGYQVFGYNTANPYFQILESRPSGKLQSVSGGGTTVKVPAQYTDTVVRIPYGYKFVNATVLVDFLLSYGEFLTRRGLTFTTVENGKTIDWRQMAVEFLYWTNQGWGPGNLINLNPSASELQVNRAGAVVDNIVALSPENQIQDQNKQLFSTQNLIIERLNNSFNARSQNTQTISFVNLRFTSYEHILIFRNVSVFGDLLYQPTTGARQNRVRLYGTVTNEWNGQLNAQGFILNQDNIEEWVPNKKYTKGEIVKFKNNYWSALTIVQPKENFDFNDWAASDREKIQIGLLPNIPNKANQLANSYNINRANLESDNDLLSYGLIGFRPRQYMAALDLDDVSQVNVYRQFVGDKGTIQSVTLLSNANFNKESADYKVFENWAILSGIYGAQANRSYIDFRLNEALLTANPSVIQLVEPRQTSTADQIFELNQVWSSSYPVTRANFLPTYTAGYNDTSLPSAGYVNLENVDITVFSIDTPDSLDQSLNNIGVGTVLWVAKTNAYEWNVYRGSKVNGYILQVTDNLDGTSVVSYSAQHGLAVGDIVVIKFFNDAVNGVYRVLGLPSLTSITIQFSFANVDQIVAVGEGISLRLQTMRVAQASDSVNLPYANEIRPGSLIWVDNDGANRWEVIQKNAPIEPLTSLLPVDPEPSNTKFAESVAQRSDNLAVLVGQPDQTYEHGYVTSYPSAGLGDYGNGTVLNFRNALNVRNYGASVSIGDLTYGSAGAPTSFYNVGYASVLKFDQASGAFFETQLLLALDTPGPAEFGASVAMSQDERWLYVGAPAANAVYAYGRVDVQSQFKTYTTVTGQFSFSTQGIQFDQATQLTVIYDGQRLTLGYHYYIPTGSNLVIFNFLPTVGSTVVIQRSVAAQLDIQSFFNLVPNVVSGLGVDATFNFNLVRGEYQAFISNAGTSYSIGETLTFYGTQFGGINPLNNAVITVVDIDNVGAIKSFTITGSFIPSSGLKNVFNISDYIYSAAGFESVTVIVNGILQRPKIDYEILNSDSSLPDSAQLDQDLVFVNIPPVGATILIEGATYFKFVQKISYSGTDATARFGSSVACSTDGRQVVIGAANENVSTTLRAGSVYIYDRHVERFQVTDTSITTYTTNAPLIYPTTVLRNNQLLQSTEFYNNGQYTAGVTSVTFLIQLAIGDIIEIETNQFQQVQKLTSDQVETRAAFGASVEVCSFNCSVYAGSPNYSGVKPQAGAVERFGNQARLYGIIKSTVQNPSLIVGNTIRVNNYEIAVPNVTADLRLSALASAITVAVPNVIASVTNGYITISVLNFDASVPGNRLTVTPGYVGALFSVLGFETFVWSQFIESPYPQDYARFGYAVDVDSTSTVLSIGAPNGTLLVPMTFDDNSTTFDAGSTDFFDFTLNTGVVYTYDFLPAANESITDPGKFIFGQEIYDNSLNEADAFGTSIDYRNSVMIVGSPGKEKTDSSIDFLGRVAIFYNPTNAPAWQIVDIQKPAVDINLLNSASMYDRLISTTNQFFDFFNPLQGKILGAAQRNIDYVGAIDPAVYNVGPVATPGNTWFAENLGKIWWDVSRIRFINPYTGNLEYTSKRWGQVFPGSVADVYQWIQSMVPPADYAGPGEVYSVTEYSVSAMLSAQGIIENIYYYWVKNLNTVATFAEKTLSTAVIARYIEDPKSSGISYVAPVAANAIAIYNGGDYIKASDTILHIEFDQSLNDAVVHTQYELIPEGKADGFLNPRLYAKMVDSFAGINAVGQSVPDTNLPPAMRYGVQFRPRQSMFVDRLAAGSNLVSFCNRIFAQFPITEYNLSFNLLNSSQPQPSQLSGEWNAKVANLEQLSWQNFEIQPVGYKYLVESDADNFGFWTIYEVVQKTESLPKTLLLVKVQNYDTKQFWSYVDWYAADYNQTDLPIYTVPLYADLATLIVPLGSTVRVTANSQNKWEIYRKTITGWDRVGLQNGTIQISVGLFDYAEGRIGFDAEVFDTQYFDYSPEQETRKVVESINQELFIDDLAIYRNELLTLVFNYILSEQESPNWLSKTSLIDVNHRIRQLLPFQSYRRDNQDFVLDYIKEVKPYHVQIRQFNLQYSGADEFQGDVTDFDLPAFYDRELLIPQYVSPILNYNGEFTDNVSAFEPNAAIWQTWPYNQWINNYLLYLDDILIENPGSGYIFPPTLTITGTATRLGTATVTINSAGEIAGVKIVDPGEGYLTTPTIVLDGGSGSGALLTPIMSHKSVRTFDIVLKYDRYEYNQTFVPWQPNDTYDNGALVSYDNRIWEANSSDSSGVNTPVFDPVDWILMPAGDLSGVDRTMGYYRATPSIPGKVLPLLISGVEYPGVQIKGVPFDAATGFDSDPYDLYPYDNIQNTPEGGVSYSDEIINSVITSSFLDTYLGTRPSDINIEGGAFVDTYSSYSPEELVPGAEFDTLDLRVYTRPGADWELDGHGFAVSNIRFEYDGTDNVFSFANLVEYPITVEVTNITQRYDLILGIDYTVDYINQSLTISTAPPVAVGDAFMVRALELGGGNQLYRTYYDGNTIPVNKTVFIPVSYSEIQELVVFYNGVNTSAFTYNEAGPDLTAVTLQGSLTDVYVSLTAFGVSPGDVVRSWSTAVNQIFTITDNSDVSYVLENYYGGTNPDNMIVTKNGIEVRPPQGQEYFVDGSSTDYALPTRGFDSQEFVSDPDVHVYVDGQPLNLGSQFTVSPWTGTETRFVTLLESPPIGSRVLIAVGTYSNYFLSANQIVFRINSTFSLAVGDIICITTWNDTSQQNLITKLWRGPVQIGSGIVEAFDSTPYSSGVDFNAPGSYDYSASTISYINNFDLERINVDATRLWVYINGRRLVNGIGFNIENQETTSYLILPTVINTNDVVTVLMPTDSIVPEAMAFRIFQDMRETQLVYRMTPNSTTSLTAPLTADADIAYLEDVTKLGTPNLTTNIWGICSINAERIMFRYIDFDNNTISGLMRGTAGTAAADHALDSIVYDMSEGNMLPMPYQNFVVLSSVISSGNTNTFVADDIDLQIGDSTDLSAALRVIVGGRTLVSTEYTVTLNDPATVVLQTTPPAGVEVTLAVLRGESWYQPGVNTPSDGRPLQLTDTIPARFLRGL